MKNPLAIRELEPVLQLAPGMADYYCGMLQSSGALTVVPLFCIRTTSDATKITGPKTGLKLSQVRGYGNLELANPGENGIAIVPLHIGYIQDKAQNHAACRSAFIAAGQKLMFEDACCVQQAQGGFLAEAQQWFFILPLQLREEALHQRRTVAFGKLWPAIAKLNAEFGLGKRGHLELILSKKRPYLNQFQSRFECLPEQVGALFLLNGKLAGIEICPTPEYFAEVWMALVCFSYGVGAMFYEQHNGTRGIEGDAFFDTKLENFGAKLKTAGDVSVELKIEALRKMVEESRAVRLESVSNSLQTIPKEEFKHTEEERFLKMTLRTVEGKNFCGQIVEESGRLCYASVFARNSYLSRN